MEQRRIILTVLEDKQANSVVFAESNLCIGYAGEHLATILGFNLPENWLNQSEKYQICFRTSDGKCYSTDLLDIAELALPSGIMIAGALYVQVLATDSDGTVIKKTEVCKCTVGKSIADGEVIAKYDGVKLVSQLTEELRTVIDEANTVKDDLATQIAGGKISTLEQRVETAIKSTNMVLKDSDTQLNGDYNNLTPNAIYTIGSAGIVAENAPYSGFVGQVHVFDFNTTRTGSNATTIQIAYSSAGRVLLRMLFKSPRVWGNWTELRNKDDYSNVLHSYGTMITTDATADSVFGNDYDNLPENTIMCIGYKSATSHNTPCSGFLGNVISTSYREGAINGKTQIAISGTNRLLHRIKWGASGVWSDWVEHEPKAKIYYVGGDSKHQSLTRLFIDLAGDTSEKTIYINPGIYDIYQEYRDAGIETPPDDVTSGDYLTRCVFVPPNTKLIGVGNVTLEWNPGKDSITLGESRTWSPLNVRYACYVENISIHCKYGRYCIHDDSHNAADDQGVSHAYKNVRCVYEYSDGGYGFNNALGFGFSQKNNYVFEDCHFEIKTNGNNSAFYGHSTSGTGVAENESPNIIVKNCVIIGGDNNNRAVRLQCLNKSALKIRTLLENCYINGGIYLNLYYDDAIHAFDVTLLKSGDPIQTVDQPENNPYPINIYE